MVRLFINLLLIFFMPLSGGKYWQEGNLSKSFDAKKNYKVAVLPITVIAPDMQERNDLKDYAYNSTVSNLTASGKIQTVAKETVEQACNKYAFGGGSINASNYKQIADELGADLLVSCQLSKEKMTIKRKEIGTVMAYVQIFDSRNGNMVMYTGKGRSLNPLSESSEVEVASEKALETLVNAMK